MGNSLTTATPQKLVFLDIDGVLNNADSDITEKYVIEEKLLEKLGKILDSVPGCEIILSSTWRMKQVSRDLARQRFHYFSCTPSGFNRMDEIAYWLGRNTNFSLPELYTDIKLFPLTDLPEKEWSLEEPMKNVTHFIVIDDTDLTKEKSLFTEFISEKFVHIDRKTGLSDSDVEKAICLLTASGK